MPAKANYGMGYAKPLAATRFKPGQSGNPKGRPKGAKNKVPALNQERLKTIIMAEAYREITVRDGDLNVSVPKYRHPENSAVTWKGMGRQPKWIIEAEAAGKSRDELLIKAYCPYWEPHDINVPKHAWFCR